MKYPGANFRLGDLEFLRTLAPTHFLVILRPGPMASRDIFRTESQTKISGVNVSEKMHCVNPE